MCAASSCPVFFPLSAEISTTVKPDYHQLLPALLQIRDARRWCGFSGQDGTGLGSHREIAGSNSVFGQYNFLTWLKRKKKKKKRSGARMTASVLKQDPNTYKVQKNAVY